MAGKRDEKQVHGWPYGLMDKLVIGIRSPVWAD